MSMTRKQIREQVLRLVYLFDFTSEEERLEQAQLYFDRPDEDDMDNPPSGASLEDQEYIRDKAIRVSSCFDTLDDELNKAARGWNTRRMGRTELAILRLALYEIRYDDEIPTGVAINEAVDLAKKYCEDEAPAFINGLLAALARTE